MNKRKRKRRKISLLIEFLAVIGLFFVGVILIWASSLKIPDMSAINERKVFQSTKIYDRTGEVLLYDIHNDVKRTVIDSSLISRHIKNATVAIEDSEFYEHGGIRLKAILRAFFAVARSGEYSQGGSTITQQVVKNTLLTSEKKIARKVKEWILSLKLEKVMTKDEILTLYLNESPYGGSVYGIEEASKYFFKKSAKDVSLAEAAYLASLPNAPTFYSPYGTNKEKLEERKNLVLLKMKESGFINEKEYSEAISEKVSFAENTETGIKAPHFVMFIKQTLEEMYGKEVVERGGFNVITTLDYEMQKRAEALAKEYAQKNKEMFNAENLALVAINPENGDILTMLGSRDYFDKEIDGNFNVSTSKRQPGSAFKPIVYAEAFKKGYSPETVVFDLQTEFSTSCNPDGTPKIIGGEKSCYMPQNYDGKFRGPISLRNALAQSINIPAIKTFYLAGQKDALRLAKDLGIRGLEDINRYGLTLVLGGGEVSLLDMTSAYSVFANDGIRNPYRAILRIEDNSGKTTKSFEEKSERVLEENVARLISDVLSDNEARIPIFGDNSPLKFENRDVAVKTGTTNDFRDAWVIGYTPNISIGVWAGNNDNTPMEKKVAGYIVAPFWRSFMDDVLRSLPNKNFIVPEKNTVPNSAPILRGLWEGGKSYIIDTLSQKKATQYTPEETRQEKVVREIHSILYWIDKENPLAPKITAPESDPQFLNWETPTRKWALENGLFDQDESVIPKEEDPFHKPELAPKISIINPTSDQKYLVENKIKASASCYGTFLISKVEFYLNGVYVGSSNKAPYGVLLPEVKTEDLLSNQNRIKLEAVCVDSVGNKGKTDVFVNFK